MDYFLRLFPEYRYLSRAKLYKKARDEGISKKEIERYFEENEEYKEQEEIYKPKQKQFKTLKITAPPNSFQLDVVILPKKYARGTSKKPKFLIAIDILSRKMFAYPLKSNKVEDVLEKYKQFVNDVGEIIHSVSGDNFFASKDFVKYNSNLYIKVYTDVAKSDHITQSSNKLGIVDRAVRTIKKIIQKIYLHKRVTFSWKNALKKAVRLYNNTEHSGIKGYTPNEVFEDRDYTEAKYLGDKRYNQKVFDKVLQKIQVGSRVRILNDRKTFQKEGPAYSKKVYIVASIKGYRFELVNEQDGKPLERLYKPDELLPLTF
jgi:hypothetical protein